MDTFAFAASCCSLQVTVQASNLKEACYLYDHLSCVTPILMALTANTPFVRGKVCDFDTRWSVFTQGCDDRTLYEMGIDDEKDQTDNINSGNKYRISKSRCGTIDSFLSTRDDFKVE